MTIKAVWEHLPRPLIMEQKHCLCNGVEMNNFMWKYNMRCNALKITPPKLNSGVYWITNHKMTVKGNFLTQQFSIHQILGSVVPRRKYYTATFQLTRLPHWYWAFHSRGRTGCDVQSLGITSQDTLWKKLGFICFHCLGTGWKPQV